MSQYKLSLPAAVLININIMMGSGIFMNMVPLAKQAGLLSPLIYATIGLLMFPVVYSTSVLLRRYPGGSFYTFGSRDINKFFGFFATWIYFTGKLASASVLIHFCTLILQSLIPAFGVVNALVLDTIIISLFAYLNMHNLKVGSIIQYSFIVFKVLPILFIILTGLFLLNPGNLTPDHMLWHGVVPVIPLVVFAFSGFEAAASLSRHIENPDKNAPLAVLISFAIVVLICITANFFFYGVVGSELSQSYVAAFPILLQKVFPFSELIRTKLTAIFQLAIACSALGGAYGILFSNGWNLYALAENKHILFSKLFAKLNKFGIPFACILLEAIICLFYLTITRGNNVPLQQIAAFGNLSAFTISALSLFWASVNKRANSFWISFLAVLNCCALLGICSYQLIHAEKNIFIIFLCLLALGTGIYFWKKSHE